MYEDLAFINPPPGVYFDKVPSCEKYPFLSSKEVDPSSFTDVLESEWPIVLNWSFELNEKAIDMHDIDNITPLGIDMELSSNIDIRNFNHVDAFNSDTENFILTCSSARNIPLYHSMHSCIKEIAKYEDSITDEMKDHIETTLNSLLGAVANNAKTKLSNDTNTDKTSKWISQSTSKTEETIQSLYPNHDKRNKDKRLKAYWEV